MPSRSSSSGDTFLIPFGLVFVLAGLGVGIFYFSMLSRWYAARSWVEVPCIIESSSLRDQISKSRDSNGRMTTSMTYEAMAKYRYEFEGRSYEGTDVSVSFGSDNFGDYQSRIASVLQDYESSGEPFRCYVNPNDPSEALIFREARWPLLLFISLFPVLFPLVGGFVSFSGWYSRRARKGQSHLQTQYPQEPWRWRREWQGEWISPKTFGTAVGWLIVAGWLTVVWGPMLVALVVESDVERSNPISWLGLLPAVLLAFVWKGTLSRLLDQKKGSLRIHVTPLPATLGTPVEIQVAIPPHISLGVQGQMHAEIRCVKRVTIRSGKSTSTRTETLGSDTISVPLSEAVREQRGSRLPLRMQIPSGLPAPSRNPEEAALQGSEQHEWELELRLTGRRHPTVFDLPVFKSLEESSVQDLPPTEGTAKRAIKPLAESMLELDADELTLHLAKHHITAVFDRRGLPVSFDLSPKRFASARLFLILFNTFWTGIFFVMLSLGAPFIFPVVWGFTSAVFWWIIIRQFEQRRVLLNETGVEIQQSIGPWRGQQRYEKRHLLEINSRVNMTSGSTSYYEIRAETTFGKKVTLMEGIPSKLVAENLAPLLERWRKQA